MSAVRLPRGIISGEKLLLLINELAESKHNGLFQQMTNSASISLNSNLSKTANTLSLLIEIGILIDDNGHIKPKIGNEKYSPESLANILITFLGKSRWAEQFVKSVTSNENKLTSDKYLIPLRNRDLPLSLIHISEPTRPY